PVPRAAAFDRKGLPPRSGGGRAPAPEQRRRQRSPDRGYEVPPAAGTEEQHGVGQNNAQEAGRSKALSLRNR
ncbi:hypothetical protein AVEN_105563-1, partial [Araneus ventricosus]